jgi:cyclopropane fatty-acyl-phospholipid synthase-like methyltransferase
MKKLCILLLCLSSFTALAQQAAPKRNQPPAAEYIKRLETESRIAGLQIERVVATFKIKPGERIADIGAGSGLFTRPMAKQTGEKGKVYAVDIDPDLLKHINEVVAKDGLKNVQTILAADADPKLPEPVDLIVIIDALHHIGNQGPYLKTLRPYLKRGGRIAVIDFGPDAWPAGHEEMKYTFAQLEGWMKDAGFKPAEQHTFLKNNFFAIFH